MLTDEEIYRRHPQLLSGRELKADEEIIKAFAGGGTMWRVWIPAWGDTGIAKIEVRDIDVYQGNCRSMHGDVIFYFPHPSDPKELEVGFIKDLQDTPGKAVFTEEESARTFLEVVRHAFESDAKWRERELSMEYAFERWQEINEHVSSMPEPEEDLEGEGTPTKNDNTFH